ncbi:MBL fold metallo-hydrolase [Roseibaca sp. V10]|uniref:MBL fold metallo-hydrolase n=1 Tax=Roseinatronobacter domitianus TaxID=2940293 RepID=A0ABT0M4Y2_9RHOB|nr:MBL fold metallo-hydrolase [Roseibaca domitiana]MCL1629924.1 MBL fold metallo-hydrolase [Roseibaca domitiana]
MDHTLYRGVHLNQELPSFARVWLLGTGSPSLQVCRHGISTLMQLRGRFFLFDTGRATLQRMYECGIPAAQVRNVFITHLHSDHICGMPDFWMTAWYVMHRSKPLRIYGPKGTERFVAGMKEMHHFDLDVRPKYETAKIEGVQIEPTEFEEGVVYDEDGITIKAFLVDHGPATPAYGFRIECDGKVIVLSGDTTYNTNLVQHATGCDLLIHAVAAASDRQLAENEITRRLIKNHTSPEQLAQVLEEAKPKMTLLHHISTWRVTEYDILSRIRSGTHQPFEMGHDRMEILVGDEIKIFPSNAPATGEDLIVSDHAD